VNIAHHLRRAARAHGERPAVARGARVLLDYAALGDRAARIGAGLRTRLGLSTGDRVALVLRNCPEYLELLYGCWYAGLLPVPTNAKLHPSELAHILDHSGARACVVTPDLATAVADAAAGTGLHALETGSHEYAGLLACDPMPIVGRGPDDPCWLFYTSGTTGRPKGATITHRNMLAMCLCYFADVDQGAPWRAVLHAAPMSHGSGLYGLAHVMQAGCHVLPESGGFDPAEIFALIERWPGLAFFAAPTMVKRLLDHPADSDTRNLKTIVYGGGPMYVEDCLGALDRFGPKLAQLYGQGESPMTITALSTAVHADRDHPRWRERLASVGTAQSVVEVRVADERGASLEPGEPGEVLVRGDSVMAGYWRDPEATARTIVDGWLHTGDVGALDGDGFLTLLDRSKDLIISGGANIYPREIEGVLVRHPAVAEAAVIGRRDREWGEVVIAYVVVRGPSPDSESLDALCLEHLARFKRPRAYRLVDALPKNNYGKVLKTTLREREETMAAALPGATT
jgi:long-chain acyl-CoA synthetase